MQVPEKAVKGTLRNPVRAMKRAMRSMCGDASRPILCAAHLDECGDVVSTDSYRLGVEHGAWDGPSIDLDLATAYDIAHHKGRCESAVIEVKGTDAKVTMGDGTVINGRIREGKYPNYSQLVNAEYHTGITVGRDELLKAARELVKGKSDMLIDTDGVHARVTSSLGKCATDVSFEHCAVGAAATIRLNSTYVRDALNGIEGKRVEIRLASATKPAIFAEGDLSTGSKVGFRSFETLVMPVRLDCEEPKKAPSKPKGWKEAPKAPEPATEERIGSLKGEHVCITGTLPTMSRSEAFIRLKLAGGIPCERFTKKVTLFVIAADAGRDKREKAEKAIAKGQKVRIVSGSEFVRALNEQGKTAGERKKEEHVAKKKEGVNRDGLAELLLAVAMDRAAKDPHNRLTEGHASQGSETYLWRLQKDGRLTKDEYGNLTSWYLDGEFVTCIERRYSKRKVELYYPEITPFAHKSDLVKSRKVEKAAEDKAGAKVKATVGEHADVTAVTIEPKKEESVEELKKELKALKAELKKSRKELDEVWKENATLKAKPKAEVPPAPKPPKDVPKAKSEDAAAVVSLESMQAWCEGKGLIATQKREGTCIWVEGESTPYKDELAAMGFRFAKKRKSWYLDPAA